jgi:hypothetical protein
VTTVDVTTWVVLLMIASPLTLLLLGALAMLRAPRHKTPEVVRELAGLARALRRWRPWT